MGSFDALRALLGLFIGAVLYVPSSLVPVLGPIASGYAQGRITKTTPGRSFLLGALSGLLGFFLWLCLINKVFNYEFNSLFSWIVLWLFFAWNLMQSLFNGMGCVFASMAQGARHVFSAKRPEPANNELDIDVQTFIICPSCGISNMDGSVNCSSCGRSLQR